MAQVRRVRFFVYYCLAVLVSAMLGVFGKARPAWADQVYRQYNAQVFNESFRVAQNANPVNVKTINAKTVNSNTVNANTVNATPSDRFLRHQTVNSGTQDGGERFLRHQTVGETGDRFLRHQTVFDVSDQAGLQLDETTGTILERGLILTPATLDFSNPQNANRDLSDAIEMINKKIESGAELTVIERAFIQSYTLNQSMLQELKLNAVKDQQK